MLSFYCLSNELPAPKLISETRLGGSGSSAKSPSSPEIPKSRLIVGPDWKDEAIFFDTNLEVLELKLYESKNHHVIISVTRPTLKEALAGATGWAIIVALGYWWLRRVTHQNRDSMPISSTQK
ncbi:hypothetical protein [Levilactobacillus zymae]|uniref:hypothetical protein n=1 Tax=Levilactobacillus zymae TaxID=267363 RepID=UPI001265DF52|nr:hypothetical protein [Levilactobacillus zymae]QFR61066.1 hypothetical protein LZ395_05785 [Levilactobacillus zymae]